jgi:hypothetical protein
MNRPTVTSSAGVCFLINPRRRDGHVVEVADLESLAVGEEQKHMERSLVGASGCVWQLKRLESREHGDQLLVE